MELSKHNNLEPTKLQLDGLNKYAPLGMSLFQDDSTPSGSWSIEMTKEGEHLGNHAKMTQSSTVEGKPTNCVEMTNVMKSTSEVDMTQKNKSTSELHMIKKNKSISEVDMP